MMHILYIYPEFTIKGGADRVIIEKANSLVEVGFRVTIVTESQMGRDFSFPLNNSVNHIDIGLDFNKQYKQGTFRRTYTYLTLLYKYKRQLSIVLKTLRPDIVITTLGRSVTIITKMRDGSMKIGESHTVKAHVRGFDQMEENGFFHCLVAKLLKKNTERSVSKLKKLVLLTKEDAADWSGIVDTVVIPNSIPFFPNECAKLENKQVIIVGRFNDAKGYNYMIEAWTIVHQHHSDWILHVYGSGELHDQVSLWIQEKQLLDTIIMHEPTIDIMSRYLESSICAMSSRYEGFPMVLLEAMSCGVPCVSFDCPYGPRNIIQNEEDGLLVDYLNSQALAKGICRLIEDKELRKRLGARARENILRFSKERVILQWKNFLYGL
jgi:glycosyltransferase involved in cell wall biosynthesis